jgi:hypothetical protein
MAFVEGLESDSFFALDVLDTLSMSKRCSGVKNILPTLFS